MYGVRLLYICHIYQRDHDELETEVLYICHIYLRDDELEKEVLYIYIYMNLKKKWCVWRGCQSQSLLPPQIALAVFVSA